MHLAITPTPQPVGSFRPRLWHMLASGLALIALSSAPGHAGDDPAASLATNLVGVSDFSDDFPFVNLMKGARDWIPGRAGCFDCREPGGNANCNAPNVCPVLLQRDGDGYVTTLDVAAQQQVRTVLHAGNAAGRLAPGDYTLRFDGVGSISVFGAAVVSSTAGQIVFNVAGSANNNIGFQITAVAAGNHIRNIRVLPPGGVCSNDDRRACDAGSPCAGGGSCQLFATAAVAEAQLFHPRFLANTEPYRLIRFMDWMETNSSPVESVDDYPTPSSAFWHRVPIEVIAELGNRLASDIWITLPHLASDAFVDSVAARLRDGFRNDRKVFVEYSNENWNGIFQQNVEIPRRFCPQYPDLIDGCRADGVPGNLIACERDPNTFSLGAASGPCFQALLRAWGDRSVQIFDRFDSVFGAAARDRVVRVIAAQAANADLGRQVLVRNVTGGGFSVASRTDAYAVAPYFGTEYCTPSDGINPDNTPAVYASLDAFMADLQARALPTAIGFMTANRSMLDSQFAGSGIRLTAYEGGQHLAGIGGFTFNATCNAMFDAANADARMGTLYRSYFDAWMQRGDEFAHFYNAGRWGPFGRWGALEFQGQDPTASPKYRAITGFIADTPCWWPGCVQEQVTVPDPAVFTDGFEGGVTSPPSCSPLQLVADPGLEATDGSNPGNVVNPSWSSTSSIFGTVFCSAALCPDDGGTVPRSGALFAWFGGVNGAETSTLSQTLVIPSGSPRHLNFFLRRSFVASPLDAVLRVKVDGVTLQTFTETAAAEAAYTVRSVALGALANGASHTLQFEYVNPSGSGKSNFIVDDITIDCTAAEQ
jgi:hypothetical protein